MSPIRDQHQGRPYQGYPYTNPAVNDAPSLDPGALAAMGKWANLPRKKVEPRSPTEDRHVFPVGKETEAINTHVRDVERVVPSAPLPSKPAPDKSPGSNDDRPVVYIDIPDESSSSTFESPVIESPGPARLSPKEEHPRASGSKDRPVVYIDIPEEGCGSTLQTQQNRPRRPAPTVAPGPSGSKEDIDRPVVYVDIEDGDGGVSQTPAEEGEPAYVQETIFYDPFKDRRISVSDSESSGNSNRRPAPPTTLNLNSPGSSGYTTNTTPGNNNMSSYLNDSYYGNSTEDDGFPLSPIPVSEFPYPPPSYTEFDHSTPVPQTRPLPPVSRPQPEVQLQPQALPPPRTAVITTPGYPGVIGLPHHDRKFLSCQHCRTMVHTLVIRENGFLTHLLAWWFMLFCLFPITAAIYLTKPCKYKNHYCPNCNKKVGYIVPGCCNNMTYCTPESLYSSNEG